MSKQTTKSILWTLLFSLLLCVTGNVMAMEQLPPIAYATDPDVIENHYIMTFSDGSAMSAALRTAIQSGGIIHHQYNGINGFSAMLPPHAMMAMRTNPDLKTIEADRIVRLPTHDVPVYDASPHLQIQNQVRMKTDENKTLLTGAGVNIYVLDSGINVAHETFTGRAILAHDVVNDGADACHNHGTGVASVIGGKDYGIATDATLHSVRVLNCELLGIVSEIIAGIEWVISNAEKPAIVNMSLGTPTFQNESSREAYTAAVKALINSGVTVFAAAGGNKAHNTCQIVPAGVDGVIAVSAIDTNDHTIATFSPRNECIDLFAPGVDISMAGNEDTEWVGSGTSFATPYVTGCAALYLESNPNATLDEIKTFLDGKSPASLVNPPATINNKVTACDLSPDISDIPDSLESNNPASPLSVSLSDSAVQIDMISLSFALFAFLILMVGTIYRVPTQELGQQKAV